MLSPPLHSYPGLLIESHKTVFSGRFAVDEVRFSHLRFDGVQSGLLTWELSRRGHAAALLPYDPWTDLVVLIEQFRLPALAAGVDPVMVEVPAGFINPGETTEAAAKREMWEETRLRADLLVPMLDVVLTPGGSDERCTLFAGRIRAPQPDTADIAGSGGLASEQEDIQVRVVPADRAIEQAADGHYPNSVTTLALLWLGLQRERLRALWTCQ
jgi:ADP-ribose pyrophosphatase